MDKCFAFFGCCEQCCIESKSLTKYFVIFLNTDLKEQILRLPNKYHLIAF